MAPVRQPADDLRKKPEARLRSALVEIRSAAEELKLGQLVNVVMETLYASLGCDRVCFFMRDKTNKRISARSGLGNAVKDLLPSLSFPDAFSPDVFHLSLANNRLYADWIAPEHIPKLAKQEIDLLTAINDVLLDAFVQSQARAVANEVRERRVA